MKPSDTLKKRAILLLFRAIYVSAMLSLFAACNGRDGMIGPSTLLNMVDEPPGKNCPVGGLKVQSGPDKNADGTLSEDEVIQTKYLCDGLSLTIISDESPGANCVVGGKKTSIGIDKNSNFELDANEVLSTSYICYPSAFEYPDKIAYGDNILAKGKTEFPATGASLNLSLSAKVPLNGKLKVIIRSSTGGYNTWFYTAPTMNWLVGIYAYDPNVSNESSQVFEYSPIELPAPELNASCAVRVGFYPGQYQVDYYEMGSTSPTYTKTITVN